MSNVSFSEKKLIAILVLMLLTILASGWYINNIHFSDELKSIDQRSENEIRLISSIIKDILRTNDYQLVEKVLVNLAKNRPEILEITLTSENNYEIVKIDRPLLSKQTITNNLSLKLPDNKSVKLKITINTDHLHSYQNQHSIKLLLGYFSIAIVLCFFTYTNIKTGRQKLALQNEIELRKKTELSFIKEKEKFEKSALKEKQLADEKEQINTKLKHEANEKIKIENDLKKLNETLEKKVDKRTQKLEKLNEKIVTVARKAGMSEVATGVLHNVGNILNSINISASIIRNNIKHSKSQELSRVVTMLEENQKNLGHFIDHNEKGKQIPLFLKMLCKQLEDERINMFTELDLFSNNIDHIKNIIQMQQSYAGQFGVKEKTRIADLIDDALKINMDNMGDINIAFNKEQTNIPEAYLDKHKILQIIINLISNAKYALLESKKDNKELRISAHGENKKIIIQVQDNGIGIDKEDITHIFEYGFKKRHDGHGFGLHNCALIANELNGKIEAYSDGIEKGTCFTLTLNDSY